MEEVYSTEDIYNQQDLENEILTLNTSVLNTLDSVRSIDPSQQFSSSSDEAGQDLTASESDQEIESQVPNLNIFTAFSSIVASPRAELDHRSQFSYVSQESWTGHEARICEEQTLMELEDFRAAEMRPTTIILDNRRLRELTNQMIDLAKQVTTESLMIPEANLLIKLDKKENENEEMEDPYTITNISYVDDEDNSFITDDIWDTQASDFPQQLQAEMTNALSDVNRSLQDQIDNLVSRKNHEHTLTQREQIYAEQYMLDLRQNWILSEVKKFNKEKDEFHREKVKEKSVLQRTVSEIRECVDASFMSEISFDLDTGSENSLFDTQIAELRAKKQQIESDIHEESMGSFYSEDIFKQLETFENDVYTIYSTKNVKRATVLLEKLRNKISNIMSYKSIYLNLNRSRVQTKKLLACEQSQTRSFQSREFPNLTPQRSFQSREFPDLTPVPCSSPQQEEDRPRPCLKLDLTAVFDKNIAKQQRCDRGTPRWSVCANTKYLDEVVDETVEEYDSIQFLSTSSRRRDDDFLFSTSPRYRDEVEENISFS